MKLKKLLEEKKSTILKHWLDHIYNTYPSDTQRFLRKQKDQFANPVGTTISQEIENLYDEFLKGLNPEKVSPILDRIIRIRAIQDFSPSKAISFIFALRSIIKNTFEEEFRDSKDFNQLWEIEGEINELALLGFDIYFSCREKVYQLREREAQIRVSGLLRRSGMISEIQDRETKLKER